MGNCVADQGDQQIGSMGMKATGPSSNEINDDVLEMAL